MNDNVNKTFPSADVKSKIIHQRKQQSTNNEWRKAAKDLMTMMMMMMMMMVMNCFCGMDDPRCISNQTIVRDTHHSNLQYAASRT